MPSAKATIDHDTIREWVEKRGGHPACVKGTGRGDDPGILRIDFPGYSGAGKLAPLEWEKFFEAFEASELAMIFQDVDDSRFNKLVARKSVEDRLEKPAKKKRGKRRTKKAAAAEAEKQVSKQHHAIRLLEQQHREVETLFADFESADTPKEKLKCFESIADALAAHSKIEETMFYPSVLADKTEEELRQAVEEHLAVKRVLADLMESDPDDPQFEAKMTVLKELVEHHVEEEEERLFPMIEQIGEESWLALGDMMWNAYERLMEEEPRRDVPRETGAPAPL